MAKWIWCGVLLAALSAGAVVYTICWRQMPSSTIASAPPEPLPVAPRQHVLPAPATTPVVPVEIVVEPIVTRPELTAELSGPRVELPTVGGFEESEVAATRIPRPDVETRRMPYADNDDFRDLLVRVQETHGGIWDFTPQMSRPATTAVSWRGLVRWAFSLGSRDMSGAEESKEPPLLDPALPDYHHPPHCPFGGFCPYPGQYRFVTPR